MRKILPFFLFVLLLSASSAYAFDLEYYTYGGFGPVTQAFTRLALIFSDTAFQGLFGFMMVLGILAGGIAWMLQAGAGRLSQANWVVPIILGAGIYLGMFVPKGNLTVYDPVLNRFQTIGNIPDAIVLGAGGLNLIERGVVDIIDTSASSGAKYIESAGGIGFKTLEAVRGSYQKNDYLRTSTIKYVKDCVSFELLRPNTTLSLDTLRNETTDFLSELGKAGNPALYTTYYTDTDPEGEVKTCRDAWSSIRSEYQNTSNYDDPIRKVCSKATFNVDESNELNRCKSLITNSMEFLTGTAVPPDSLIKQRSISEILYNFYLQEDAETAMQMEANRKITSQGIGAGIAMNEWVPVIKAIMTAIAIGMVPFLALFLPTPVMGKAASAMFGFFCFLTIWGVTDAVIHVAAMDYAAYLFEDVRQSNLGVYAMASLPNKAVQMLSMFGIIRGSGLMLASLFTMMLVRFGGHALAMMAGQVTGMVSSAGGQAGALLTPEGKANFMKQQKEAAGLLEGMPQHAFSNMAAASAYSNVHRPVGGYNAAMNAKGALERAGKIDPGTSPKDYAERQQGFNQQATTNYGQASVTIGPDGQAVKMNTFEINPETGSAKTDTTGPGGAGVGAFDNAAWGSAKFTKDGHGGETLTSASINGMSPMALARQNASILTEKASHSFGTNQGWGKLTSQLRTDSLTSNEARGYADKLSNSEASGWDRIINDKSGFVHTLSKEKQEQLAAFVGAGGSVGFELLGNGAKATAGAEYKLTGTNKDGDKIDFTVDENTAKAFKENQQQVREKAFTETFGSGQALQYATSLAHKVDETEAALYMKDASSMSRTTETTGADATAAFVRWYAKDRNFGDTPEGIDKAGKELNYWATSGGSAGLDTLQKHQQRFLKTGGYTWGDGKAEAESVINATRGEVGGGMGIKGQVMSAANTASGRTENIAPGDFSGHPADRHKPLVKPSEKRQEIIDEANAQRDPRKEYEKGGVLAGDRIVYNAGKILDGKEDYPQTDDKIVSP